MILESAVETRATTPAFLDDIANLQDPAMFSDIIEAEWTARKPTKDKKDEPIKTASAMARVIGNKYVPCNVAKTPGVTG
jgi:hypothetical protein